MLRLPLLVAAGLFTLTPWASPPLALALGAALALLVGNPSPEWTGMAARTLLQAAINLGSNELVSINDLVTYVEDIAGIKLNRKYKLDAPKGVAGRNSDNTFIKQTLNWEPSTKLKDGLKHTYKWIEQQYQDRKAGKRTVEDKI